MFFITRPQQYMDLTQLRISDKKNIKISPTRQVYLREAIMTYLFLPIFLSVYFYLFQLLLHLAFLLFLIFKSSPYQLFKGINDSLGGQIFSSSKVSVSFGVLSPPFLYLYVIEFLKVCGDPQLFGGCVPMDGTWKLRASLQSDLDQLCLGVSVVRSFVLN